MMQSVKGRRNDYNDVESALFRLGNYALIEIAAFVPRDSLHSFFLAKKFFSDIRRWDPLYDMLVQRDFPNQYEAMFMQCQEHRDFTWFGIYQLLFTMDKYSPEYFSLLEYDKKLVKQGHKFVDFYSASLEEREKMRKRQSLVLYVRPLVRVPLCLATFAIDITRMVSILLAIDEGHSKFVTDLLSKGRINTAKSQLAVSWGPRNRFSYFKKTQKELPYINCNNEIFGEFLEATKDAYDFNNPLLFKKAVLHADLERLKILDADSRMFPEPTLQNGLDTSMGIADRTLNCAAIKILAGYYAKEYLLKWARKYSCRCVMEVLTDNQ